MPSKEELEAMGIKVMQCKECCRDISEEEYKRNNGYCKNCYADKENIEYKRKEYNSPMKEKNIYVESDTNTVAKIIKIISVISAIASIILGLISIEDLEVYAIAVIVGGCISSIFVYAVGEIIQLLQDIKNNTKK